MKKLFIGTLSVSALLISFNLLGSHSVEAAQAGAMTSNADITFLQDTTVTSPVNPTDPTQTVTANPDDPHQAGTAGPLSIDYISNFHFGSQPIKATTATYYAQLDKVKNTNGDLINVPNYAQITDKRGLNLGWKLSVKQNGQFTTGGATPSTLTNAALTLVAATTNSTQSVALAPITVAATLDPTGTATSRVATSAASTGMGTWTLAFGTGASAAQGVQLSVPQATAKVTSVQYKTTLNWILDDTPL